MLDTVCLQHVETDSGGDAVRVRTVRKCTGVGCKTATLIELLSYKTCDRDVRQTRYRYVGRGDACDAAASRLRPAFHSVTLTNRCGCGATERRTFPVHLTFRHRASYI